MLILTTNLQRCSKEASKQHMLLESGNHNCSHSPVLAHQRGASVAGIFPSVFLDGEPLQSLEELF